MRDRYLEALVYGVAVVSWLASGVIHFPGLGFSIYSDVISFWLRPESSGLQRGEAPCFEFFFEYPPIACLATHASALLGEGDMDRYYRAFFFLSLPAYLAIAWSILSISRQSGAGRLGLVFIASPSLVVYGIYNFDHFATAFTGLSVALLLQRRILVSSLLAGLGFATKIYTVLLLPAILLELKGRERYLFLAGFASGSLPLFAAQELLNPGMFGRFIQFLSGWGLENAWYIWIFWDQFSPTAKTLGILLGGFLVIHFSLRRGELLPRLLLAVSGWLLMYYIFTPQMAIWLLPLFSAVPRVIPLWPAFEVANIGIILTWFGDYNPVMPPSPPQIMALVRAASLALIILTVYRSLGKSRTL
jgi:hypothetical protein